MRDPHTMNVCAVRRASDGYWWECSAEHGAGWHKRIRQALTLREADQEVLRLIEHGWAKTEDLEVVELGPLPPGAFDEAPSSKPCSPWIAVAPWISVADALSDDPDEEVVALAGGCPTLAHYREPSSWVNAWGYGLLGVTHWARWPESPDSPNA